MLRTRILTACALGSATIVTVLLLPTWLAAAVFGLLWIVGVWEWAHFVKGHRIPPAIYTAVFVGLMLATGPLFDAQGAVWVAVVALIWWALASVSLWMYPWRFPVTFVAASGPLTLLPAWFLLAYIHGGVPRGPELALSLLVIIWAADVGAYLVGRRVGRVKLALHISPGKTWEGVIGGLVSAALAASLAGIILDLPLGAFVAIALVASLVSVVGDLTVSMFKRNASLKDSGQLLPGHGGVLDRIDSLAAAVPFFYIGLKIAGL